MTANTLSPIQSSPFTGLGTQSLTITSTGIYTIQTRVTIPWITSDQPAATANPGVLEIQDVTCAADSSGSRNSTWWKFYTAGDVVGYYVWYNINSAGVDPAPAGLTGIEVAGATGATATTLGGASRTAIAASAANAYVKVSGGTSHVILTNRVPGVCTAAANGTASAGASFSITATGSFGYASGLMIQVKQNSTVLATYSLPSPSQASMGGSVTASLTAADVVNVVLSSSAAADAVLNAVKGVVNIFLGE